MPGGERRCPWRRIVVAGAFAALAWSAAYAKDFDRLPSRRRTNISHKEISRPPKSSCATRSAMRLKIPFCVRVSPKCICSSAMPYRPSARRGPPASVTAMRPITCRCWQTPCFAKQKFANLIELVQPAIGIRSSRARSGPRSVPRPRVWATEPRPRRC